MTRYRFACAVLSALIASATQAHAKPASTLFSGVNDVQFTAQPEQRFLGSGFVIEHDGHLYGVTAKHVLLMRKDGPPANTDIQSELSHWQLRDPRSKATLAFGRLLNGDASEPVDAAVLKRDSLLFELADAGPFKPLQLAKHEPRAGDRLRAIGCSYASESSCAQDVYSGTLVERQGPNLLIDLGAQPLDAMFGLSGAPVLNDAGELVGLVSNVLPDASGKPRFAPVDIAYLRTLLKNAKSR
jgi:S1-C subfamily serine protease